MDEYEEPSAEYMEEFSRILYGYLDIYSEEIDSWTCRLHTALHHLLALAEYGAEVLKNSTSSSDFNPDWYEHMAEYTKVGDLAEIGRWYISGRRRKTYSENIPAHVVHCEHWLCPNGKCCDCDEPTWGSSFSSLKDVQVFNERLYTCPGRKGDH